MKNILATVAHSMTLFACLALFATAAQAEIKIVALGYSHFVSKAGPTKEGYPEQLQVALRAQGYDVVVSNAGVWGDTTTGVLNRLDKAVPVDTQIVILTIGANDIRLGISASETMRNIDTIVERLRAKGAEVIMIRWVLPYGQYVDEGGTIPVVERLPDRIVIPSLLRGIPPELITMGLHPMGAGNAIAVTRTLPAIKEVIAKVTKGQ